MIRDAKIVAEYTLYIIFMICVFLIFATHYFPHYDLAYIANLAFIFYVPLEGLKLRESKLVWAFTFLLVLMLISPTINNVSFYNTDYRHLLSYSLIGVETFLINRSFLSKESHLWILKYFAYMYMLAGFLGYYYCLTHTMASLNKTDISQLSNIFYAIIMPLPLFYSFAKEKSRNIVFFIVAIGVIYTAKRSGTIIIVLSSIPILISLYRKLKSKSLLLSLIGFFVFSIALLYYGDKMMSSYQVEHVVDRFEDLEEDGGSGRTKIIDIAFSEIKKFDTNDFLFGRGFGSFARITSFYLSAHNDFLELFYSFGFIAAIIYLLIIFYLTVGVFQMFRSRFAISNWIFLLIFIVIGVTGNIFFYYSYTIPTFIYMAFFDVKKREFELDKVVL